MRRPPQGLLQIDRGTVFVDRHLDGQYLLHSSVPTLSAEDLALGRRRPLVALPATRNQGLGAAGGVRPNSQLPPGQLGTVTGVMAALEHRRHGGEGRVQQLQVVLRPAGRTTSPPRR